MGQSVWDERPLTRELKDYAAGGQAWLWLPPLQSHVFNLGIWNLGIFFSMIVSRYSIIAVIYFNVLGTQKVTPGRTAYAAYWVSAVPLIRRPRRENPRQKSLSLFRALGMSTATLQASNLEGLMHRYLWSEQGHPKSNHRLKVSTLTSQVRDTSFGSFFAFYV